MLPASILALPALAPDVPGRYIVPGADAFAVPLTIALLEAGVITGAMLRAPRNALLLDVFEEDERQLSARALSHWWTKLIRATPCKFFRWQLHVQQLDGVDYDKATTAWFLFARMDGDIPRFALSKGVERLESIKEGFGQTVLAVLRDATALLPDAFTPWQALDLAQYIHWEYTRNDAELLEQRRRNGGHETVKQLLESEEVVTRAVFFAEIPEWACAPKRVLDRAAILEATGGNRFARQAIEICDALHALVSGSGFTLRPSDKGAYRCGKDSIDGAMCLVWNPFDVLGQTIDDHLNHLGEAGEYCDFIDANPVPMTAAGVREFMTLTEQALQVAVLTEKLVLLLGEKF
jgi:PRTRC genetic system protein F